MNTEYFQKVISFIRQVYNNQTGFIPLHAPLFQGKEKEYVLDCINSTYVSSVGKYVNLFEQKVAEFTGSEKAVATVNGTSALHMALKLVGVANNTEVITQPVTFVATTNAIIYCGAKPVFLDVDKETMGLSSEALQNWLDENVEMRKVNTINDDIKFNYQAFNKFTKRRIAACLPVHTMGFPCRMDELVNVCNNYNIPLIEDAAESLGSYYKEKHTGTFGDIGILSFNGNKIITTGGGGMMLFNDINLAQKAKHLTTQAKSSHQWEFFHDDIGYNYRMPNINAALGCAQLEMLPAYLESKKKIAQRYKYFFEKNELVRYVEGPLNSKPNYWLNNILLNSKTQRDNFLAYSNKNKIMTRPLWHLMNELPMFKIFQKDSLQNAQELSECIVSIPSSPII